MDEQDFYFEISYFTKERNWEKWEDRTVWSAREKVRATSEHSARRMLMDRYLSKNRQVQSIVKAAKV